VFYNIHFTLLYFWERSQKIHCVSQEKYHKFTSSQVHKSHTWRIIWVSRIIAEQLRKRMD